MLSCTTFFIRSWEAEEAIDILRITMPRSTWRLPFFVLVNFCLVLFITFDTFKTWLSLSLATMDMKLFVAGAKHTLRVVFSPVLLVCHFSSFRYLLKLCVVFLNTIYDVICSFIWPMFTTYCELQAVNKIKMTKAVRSLKKLLSQWIEFYNLFVT